VPEKHFLKAYRTMFHAKVSCFAEKGTFMLGVNS
jgi:hypothetical protein